MSKGVRVTGQHTWCTAGLLSDLSAKVIGFSSRGWRLLSWPQVANASHSFCQAAKVATGSLVLLVWVNSFSTSCTAENPNQDHVQNISSWSQMRVCWLQHTGEWVVLCRASTYRRVGGVV